MADELLVVEDLKKHFPVTRGIVFQKEVASVKAVDGVSFTVNRGETLGVVGESGCGKSTMARCIMRLLDPTAGRVVFEGRDITTLSRAQLRPIRREMMMIFQDPYASLNARKRVGFIIGDADMGLYELSQSSMATWQALKDRFERIVWLNPMEIKYWENSTTVNVLKSVFDMFPLSPYGIEKGVELMNKKRRFK